MSDPIPVCCALIVDQGKVMIARRPEDKHLGGEWEFPGGKIEPHEAPADALVREIQEELGCTIRITDSLEPIVHVYSRATIRLHAFVARLDRDSPPPHPQEHTALRWLDHEALAQAALAPADMPIVNLYLQRYA